MKKIGIGVAVFIFNNGLVLFGKRKGGTGDGEWCLPSGKLEFCERLESGALREVFEETGIQLECIQFVNLTNDPRELRGEHYLHVNFVGQTTSQPRLAEEDKFYEWQWFDLDKLPSPIFFGHVKMIKSYKKGEIICD